ncbi:hypothetical protein CGLO_00065 [Colletotrichum gloeosporioides Cg-14]|uniref:Prolyl 4-hydroxylase alpha subunit domain-containing protein n=1 Tax=Colletotrichum gloeosporioides (strain Cg-14) TaxID=1237896 RepID=T0L495_COLGC|nr:hypothetical protein CGLO_00065 [Colletotrichum gloeosporioides Cg-14]
MYVVGFIPKYERDYLLRLGAPLYERSSITGDNDTELISEVRTSTTAVLPDDDPVVQRIIARASELQGYTSLEKHEPLQLTRYSTGQQFRPHHDITLEPDRPLRRLTTLFAILEATCNDCGTTFPELSVNWTAEDQRWCEFADCRNSSSLTIRAVPGNAVFWKNYNNSYDVDPKTLHAGLPPERGVKTGLNLWTNG